MRAPSFPSLQYAGLQNARSARKGAPLWTSATQERSPGEFIREMTGEMEKGQHPWVLPLFEERENLQRESPGSYLFL